MHEVQTYSSLDEAIRALDNGGRFYHFFSKAGDDVITPAELHKVAGAFGNDRTASLFFSLATWDLDETEQRKLDARLEPDTRMLLSQHQPQVLAPDSFQDEAEIGKPVIVEGEVRVVDDETETGMIFVPVMVNNVMTMQMLPTSTSYTVYQVGDGPRCHVLAAKRDKPLGGAVRFGGLIKESPPEEKGNPSPGPRLEAAFFSAV